MPTSISAEHFHFVTPAQAGVQGNRSTLALDSRLRGNDEGKRGE